MSDNSSSSTGALKPDTKAARAFAKHAIYGVATRDERAMATQLNAFCDRIEELERALRVLMTAPPPIIGDSGWDDAHRVARAALEGA